MYQVIKRDGKIADFDITKIKNAIEKAFVACNRQEHPSITDFLALKTASHFESKIKNGFITVEDIQDSVEAVLSQSGYADVAKAYILYRKQHEKMRNIKGTFLDYKKLVDSYVNVSDWRVKENSTVNYSIGGLILSNSGAITANYWLSEVYDEEIANAHKNADLHIHDLSILGPYCAGWSLKRLIQEGIGGVSGKITSAPASHLSTLCNQMVNFLGILQNEWAGAQAFSSFDTYLAPFVKKDNLSYKEVKQCIQSLIYGLNVSSRWGCVTDDTEVLSTEGFKKYNELKEGDLIYTWKDGRLEINPVNKVVIKPFKGKMHAYIGRGYNQTVTPEHRVLISKDRSGNCEIKLSEELFNRDDIYLPVSFSKAINNPEDFASFFDDKTTTDDEIIFDISEFHDCSADRLQHLALLVGYTSYIEGNKLHCRKTPTIKISSKQEINYDGIVWCPSVDNGTAVFRKDGCVFVSGQSQAPFTNVTIDWTVPDDLAELNAIVGGKEQDFKYKDCKKEMDMINKAFMEIMIEGDANGRNFQYPIPTYSITKDFDWSETENNKLLFEMAAKYGTPYFSNYVNSDMSPSDSRSMCCRLKLDLRELRRKNGGFFGSGEETGSIGVVTLNLPRLAYLSLDEKDFYARLDKLLDIAARSLKIKRETVSKLLEEGLYPYTKHYLGSFNNHFSTIGLVGMNEAGLNAKWLRADMTHPETQKFAQDVLNHIRERLSDYQEMYGDLYNLEATPAESTSYRLAKHDKERYPDIITASEETPYYTNSTHLPVGYTEDIFSALDVQDDLQVLYNSGTVFHGFLGEKLPDWKSAMNLVRKIAENYKLPYYTLSPTYSICKNHGYIKGEVYECPECKEKTEVYSRITGYYRPIQNWNVGKAQEFKDRKTYAINSSEQKEDPDCKSCSVKVPSKQEIAVNAALVDGLYLIKTASCPNCKIAEAKLNKAGISYTKILADDNTELVTSLNIKQAPTLVEVKDGNYEKYTGVSPITKFIESR